ncbi:uncharacterized protein LOC111029443 [Myzus persicae]|uniref:uncharacterized protein LOC111029443 n=1 Tax=Myzus persicae TaxID=13164 RepID=UPI000B9342FC|nr:uncharacterized protein LOC111029443 [Myzus persicae]
MDSGLDLLLEISEKKKNPNFLLRLAGGTETNINDGDKSRRSHDCRVYRAVDKSDHCSNSSSRTPCRRQNKYNTTGDPPRTASRLVEIIKTVSFNKYFESLKQKELVVRNEKAHY